MILHAHVHAVPGFAGRDAELLAIETALWVKGGRAALTNSNSVSAALKGLGGVGKSMLAQEFAWRNRDHYQGVWWIRAETHETLLDDLIELGGRFLSGLKQVPDRAKAARMALDALAQHTSDKPWMLVYDNVEIPHSIANLMPVDGAHVLITTRWSDWYGRVEELPIDVFPREVAIEFLMARTKRGDPQAAGRLADDLGWLPLALSHARSYCWDMNWSFDQYRSKLPELIKTAPGDAAYPAPVFATFRLAIEKASAQCPETERLMGIFAFLAPERIPLDIVKSDLLSEIELGEAVAALAELSLVTLETLDDGTPGISLHRLVQEVMRGRLIAQGEHTLSAALAVRLLVDSLPYEFNAGEFRDWATWSRIMPHALAVLPHAPYSGKSAQKTALLLKHAAIYQTARAQYAEAEALFRRALATSEVVLGPNHQDVAFILNDFCTLLTALKRLDEAEPLIRRALAIDEAHYGPNHESVAIRLGNLAEVLTEMHRYSEAEPLFRRAISITEANGGPDHLRLSTRLCNLALLCSAQDRNSEAEELYNRSLKIAQRAVGANHPDVANRLINLGQLLRKTKRLPEAEAAMRRALVIDEAAFGADHPYVADDLRNLARLLLDTGRLGEAEPLMLRALAICEATFPTGHPWTDWLRNDHAELLAAWRVGHDLDEVRVKSSPADFKTAQTPSDLPPRGWNWLKRWLGN